MKKPATQTGGKAIRAHFEDAAARLADRPAEFVDYNLERFGFKPGKWPGAPFANMPPECPVTVVGRDAEGLVYVISASGHLRSVEKWDHATVAGLFAPQSDYAYWAWPGLGKPRKKENEDGTVTTLAPLVKRIEIIELATCLITEAARLPEFDPLQDHHGRGGWKTESGKFLWHSGDALWFIDKLGKLQTSRPARHEDKFYTRQMPTVAPWLTPVSQAESPAQGILRALLTWNWGRPYLDPILNLGWLGTSIYGAALKNRPIIFATGGRGVGKSTLDELIGGALQKLVTRVSNTTAAHIYQKNRRDALAFMIDEAESKPGAHKVEDVLEMARIAYSGGEIGRGSQGGESVSYKMRASFYFSAINPPPMTSADKSRMAVINLHKLTPQEGAHNPPLLREEDARMILRQMMDGWEEFNSKLMPVYWDILHRKGFDSRQIDTFGTLLAAAELLVGPQALEDAGLPVRDVERVGQIISEATALERSESLDNWHQCLNVLLDSPIDAWRDGQKPVVGAVCDDFRLGAFDLKAARQRLEHVNLGAANAEIASLGLPGRCLAIPPDGPQLKKIFADTPYQQGVWFSALKQAPRHIVLQNSNEHNSLKIAGVAKRCLFIDLAEFHRFTGSVE